MALTIGDNFKYQANKPNFERDSFATLEAMKAYPETSIDDGHLSYCAETNKHYKFLSSNTVDETTGKWREFETTVGNNFPSDGVEGQYLKKSNTGVKWDDGDIFYLNPKDFASGSVTQDIYNKLVNAITNNKIIYITSNFGGQNMSFSPISSDYTESSGITFVVLMDDTIYNLHINPNLTFVQEELISLDLGNYIQYKQFILTSFNISGNTVTYSPTVISSSEAEVFFDAEYRHKLRLGLRGIPADDWVELFLIQYKTINGDSPDSLSFMGIFNYDGKSYTMILSLVGLSTDDNRDYQLIIKVIPHFSIENSTFRNNQFIKRNEDNTYEWSTIEYPRIVLSEFSTKKFFDEYPMVVGADSIGWAGALLVDDFSSDKYRDFYCCMTYGQGIVIRHTYATDTYEYLNSFLVDFSTTSSSYTKTNKMNSGGWGKVYEGSSLPLAYISRCSPDSNYIHTYYAYQIDTSVTPYNFVKKLTIKYNGSKLADITSDITVDAEKKYLYIHGYKTGSIDAIRGTSLVMVFNLPEPGSSNTITLTDNDIVWEFEFFIDEAAQDLHVSGGRLYYPYGGPNHHGLAVIDTSNGAILQNIDLTNISTNFIDHPEPEGVYVSNGKLYLNYHHSNSNKNEVCLVEFPLQEVKESIPVATTNTNGLMSAADKEKLDSLNVDGGSTIVTDERALKGATMRFNGFVNGVTITQTGVNEWDGIVYDTSINKFLAKKGTLTPTYHNVWSGMDAYMSDELGTSILKDKLYLYGEDIYKWSDSEGTLVKVTSEGSSTTPDIPLATQSTDGLMSSEDKTKLDNIDVDSITEAINDKRALNGATMRFSNFVNGVTVEQVGTVEFDSIVFDTAINKFLAKKNGTLSPTYYNVWQGMDAYMSDESGTSILKDKLYICDDVVYSWSDVENTLVKVDKEISNATQSRAGLMSAEDKAKLDNLNTSGEVSDPRALKGATMRFNGFVSGVTTAQVGASEWDSVVYDTSINKFLAKKGTLSPTYYNIWSGMDAYMTDGAGTDILKDRLYLYGEDIYAWSNTEGTLIKVTPDIPNASQSEAGLMSAEDKTKLDNVINRIVLSEFSERKFFGEFSKVTGASAIGWAGALFIDDFSNSEYRDFYCCMTYGQGIVIRHTYKTDTYEYLNSFMVDSSTTSSSYNITNKMNSGGWGKYYNNSELPLAYISRCSPNASYIHTYYAYKINRSVTPFKFERVLTIKYGGSKLAAITSDITIDAEKKYLYVHGYKSGSADAITGTSIVMVFNLPEPGSSDTITLNDSDILWEFEFFVNEAAQDLCVSGGKLYYPYGSKALHGLAVIDTKTGKIIQNLNLSTLSTNFIDNPEPEGVALSNGNVYLNYHHSGTNSNEVCLVEFPLQEVKEALKVPTKVSQLENDAEYITAKGDLLERLYMYGIEFDTTVADPACIRIGNPDMHRTLPIHSQMRGCLLDDYGKVIRYLNPDTWEGETIDGSNGQVMVEIPEFYIKFEEDGTKRRVKMSPVLIPGYHKVSKAYISAYEATIQRSTNKLSSVCNEDADYRGGNNDSSRDDTYRTQLGMPVTKGLVDNLRNYASNRGKGWHCYSYHLHKILWWLFAVEYANFNSQDTFNATLDENGYHQGGLGVGVTTLDGSAWSAFNNYLPLVPCGVTNLLGNHTGTVDYILIGSDGLPITTFAVPRYRGIENPFGHLWKSMDGCKCIIQSETAGGSSRFYVCNNPLDFVSNISENYNYLGDLPRKSGSISSIAFGENGEIIPSEVGGGSTTYFCDYFYTGIPSSGKEDRYISVGGGADNSAFAGFLFMYTNVGGENGSNVGTRLCCIPTIN